MNKKILSLFGAASVIVSLTVVAVAQAAKPDCDAQYAADSKICASLSPASLVSLCRGTASTRYGECLSKGAPSSPLATKL
jgi:hypothetical protein